MCHLFTPLPPAERRGPDMRTGTAASRPSSSISGRYILCRMQGTVWHVTLCTWSSALGHFACYFPDNALAPVDVHHLGWTRSICAHHVPVRSCMAWQRRRNATCCPLWRDPTEYQSRVWDPFLSSLRGMVRGFANVAELHFIFGKCLNDMMCSQSHLQVYISTFIRSSWFCFLLPSICLCP